MGGLRLALATVLTALVAAGCGGGNKAPENVTSEPLPPMTSSTPAVTPAAPQGTNPLASLSSRQQKALAPLTQAQVALSSRGDAVANAGADASKVVARIASGYTPPSGPATPEVGRLAQALSAFGDALAPIGTDPSLLPQLSLQLQRRAEQIVKKDPQTAGRLVNAKQQVDSVVQALPRLRQAVAGAASRAGDEASKQTLSAQSLDQAIRNGADSATTALNGVNQAIDAGVAALSAAA